MDLSAEVSAEVAGAPVGRLKLLTGQVREYEVLGLSSGTPGRISVRCSTFRSAIRYSICFWNALRERRSRKEDRRCTRHRRTSAFSCLLVPELWGTRSLQLGSGVKTRFHG